jgi:hypothetical protein
MTSRLLVITFRLTLALEALDARSLDLISFLTASQNSIVRLRTLVHSQQHSQLNSYCRLCTVHSHFDSQLFCHLRCADELLILTVEV